MKTTSNKYAVSFAGFMAILVLVSYASVAEAVMCPNPLTGIQYYCSFACGPNGTCASDPGGGTIIPSNSCSISGTTYPAGYVNPANKCQRCDTATNPGNWTTFVTCNDSNSCTTDVCNPSTGACVFTAKSCDDSDACTVDSCSAGICAHTPKSCNDSNACTNDSCNSVTGQCAHSAVPAEACDGVDNNCNGTIDEGFNVGVTCWAGVGECKSDGKFECDSQTRGGSGTICNAIAKSPTSEICDNKDNNCNGQIDEGLGTTTCGKGVCSHTVNKCVGGATQICDPMLGSSLEICDGLDNDCDGLVDEDIFPVPVPGDACKQQVCIFGSLVSQAVADGKICDDKSKCTAIDKCMSGVCTGMEPVVCTAKDQCHKPGVCNSGTGICSDPMLDNGTLCDDSSLCTKNDLCKEGFCTPGNVISCEDGNVCTSNSCDPAKGCVQSNYDTGITLSCGQGVCKNTVNECSGGTLQECKPLNVATAEICDNKDNNCNGSIDELLSQSCYTGPVETVGIGQCKSGSQSCATGNWGLCAGEIKPATEICNGVDDDCDGQIDEGLGTISCGTGECVNTVPACLNGKPNTCAVTATDGKSCNFDNSLCTQNDSCLGGVCKGGPSINCNDSKTCTTDACNPATGLCSNTIQAGKCLISGACYSNGYNVAGAYCQTCNTAVSQTAWSAKPSGTVCRAASTAGCDVAEVCDGVLTSCPANKYAASGTECRGLGGDCDIAEKCTGASASCPTDKVMPATTICRSSKGACDTAEKCSGTLTNKSCPADLFNEGASCTDNDLCTSKDVCGGGSCTGTPYSCDDNNPCTVDACTGLGSCTHIKIDADNDGYSTCEGDCDDNDPARSPGTSEKCDNKDNNCNGTVDDGFNVGLDCSVGTGECAVAGAIECGPDLKAHCTANINEKDLAPCNVDNNVCTANYCKAGKCMTVADGVEIKTISCDDKNVCTSDSCDSSKGCQSTPIDADKDGVPDCQDNCPSGPNPDQENTYGDIKGDICDVPYCGNGIWEVAGGEECDQGKNNSNGQPDACRLDCTKPKCGDMIVDTGEACDDGNFDDTDGCKNDCSFPSCGDGVFTSSKEECDAGQPQLGVNQYCDQTTCVVKYKAYCGDGVAQFEPSNDYGVAEECDMNDLRGATCDSLGKNFNGGTLLCGSDCQFDTGQCNKPFCGDGFLDGEIDEACDNGTANSDTTPDACRTNCIGAKCGDKVVDTGEVCDEGYGLNGSVGHCKLDCQSKDIPECLEGETTSCELSESSQCFKGIQNCVVSTGKWDSVCIPLALPEGTECNDNNVCTGPDVCADGTCFALPINCDDGDKCTTDSCGDGGCIHTAIEGCCSSDFQCDDGNACTADQCSPINGTCSHKQMGLACCNSDAECDDSSACTTDSCVNNSCVHVDAPPPPCSNGACQGNSICNNGNWVCFVQAPISEICDGKDNDCNDLIDDNLAPITCGVGECAKTVLSCQNGITAVCVPGIPSAEICDGKDNDCNSIIDDGFATKPELCNGLDDNCNSQIDEGIAPIVCRTNCGEGNSVCSGGQMTACNAPQPSVEVCDYADNNCNGEIDEGVKNACGNCEVLVEVCGDEIDNNCNGAVDEDCVSFEKEPEPEPLVRDPKSDIFDLSKTRGVSISRDLKEFSDFDIKDIESAEVDGKYPEQAVIMEVRTSDNSKWIVTVALADLSVSFEKIEEAVALQTGQTNPLLAPEKIKELFGEGFAGVSGSIENVSGNKPYLFAMDTDSVKAGFLDGENVVKSANEHYYCISKIDKFGDEEKDLFTLPKLPVGVDFNNYGGTDLTFICKNNLASPEWAIIIQINKNEFPSVNIEAPAETADDGTQKSIFEAGLKFNANGTDPTNDPLKYQWSCKNSEDGACNGLLSGTDTKEVVLGKSAGVDISTSLATQKCPYTLSVTATDPAGDSAESSIIVACDGGSKAIEKVEPAAIPPVPVTPAGWAEVSGGSPWACGANISESRYDSRGALTISALLLFTGLTLVFQRFVPVLLRNRRRRRIAVRRRPAYPSDPNHYKF